VPKKVVLFDRMVLKVAGIAMCNVGNFSIHHWTFNTSDRFPHSPITAYLKPQASTQMKKLLTFRPSINIGCLFICNQPRGLISKTCNHSQCTRPRIWHWTPLPFN